MVLKDDLYYYAEEEAYIRGNDPKVTQECFYSHMHNITGLVGLCFSQGIIRLDIFFASVLEGDNAELQFTIHALPKSLTCRADTEEEMYQWVETINLFGRAG